MNTIERFRVKPKGTTIRAATFKCPECGASYLVRKRRAVNIQGVWVYVCRQCKRELNRTGKAIA